MQHTDGVCTLCAC